MTTKTKHLKYDFLYTICTRHTCPKCGSALKAQRATKTVKPSAHSGEYEFDAVRLVFREFVCAKCKSHFSIEEIRQHEGTQKRRNNNDVQAKNN